MRQPGQLKSLMSVLNRSGSHLDTLKFEADIHAERSRLIHELLPSSLATEVSTGELNQGLLTLYVPVAGLASQLRFEEPRLIDALKQHPLFPGIRRLQCRVRPKATAPHPPAPAKREPSPKAAEALEALSKTLTDDELRRQFQRLAAQVSGNLPPDQT